MSVQLHSNFPILKSNKRVPSPFWFTLFAVLLLVWNALGVFNFLQTALLTPHEVAAMAIEKQPFFSSSTALILFGWSTITAFIGSVLLIIKRCPSLLFFILSLIGVIAHLFVNLKIATDFPSEKPVIISVAFVLITIGAFSVGLSYLGKIRKWIV